MDIDEDLKVVKESYGKGTLAYDVALEAQLVIGSLRMEKACKWINVNKQAPPQVGRTSYLCSDGYTMFVTEYRDYKLGYDFDPYYGKVIFWQPLPQLPEEA